MEQEISNQEIMNKLNEIEIQINLLKERLSEEESLPSVEEQLEMGLKDMREGKIMQLA